MGFKFISDEKREEVSRQYNETYEFERKTVSFTGHRPQKTGGFDNNNPQAKNIKEKLTEIISDLIENEGIERFISGGALGVDTYAFECVQLLKKKYPQIKNILAAPFLKQDNVWSDSQKRLYARMKKVADEIVYVDEINKYSISGLQIGEYNVAKMQKRNEYMVDHSRIVVAVYDGTKGGTGNCVRYAYNKRKTIYKIHPKSLELEITYGLFH